MANTLGQRNLTMLVLTHSRLVGDRNEAIIQVRLGGSHVVMNEPPVKARHILPNEITTQPVTIVSVRVTEL